MGEGHSDAAGTVSLCTESKRKKCSEGSSGFLAGCSELRPACIDLQDIASFILTLWLIVEHARRFRDFITQDHKEKATIKRGMCQQPMLFS